MDKKEQENNKVEIDILPILKTIFTKWWLMLLVGLIFAGSFLLFTKLFIKPTYRCGFTAYINNQHAQSNKDTLSVSDLTASKQLTETYVFILKSETILSAAANKINTTLPYSQLRDMVEANVEGETEVIAIHTISEDPQFSYDFTSAIAQVAPEHMAKIVEGSSMKIIDYPVYNTNRYKPSYSKFAILGFVIGVILVIILEIIKFFKDDTIKSENDIESHFDIPILGVIPDVSSINNKSTYYSYGKSYYEQTIKEDKNE